jgi:hypothetical protein
VAAPLKTRFSVWLKLRFRPRVCCTEALIHCPLPLRTQSDDVRITTPSPQHAQNLPRLWNRYGVTTTGSSSAVRTGPRPGHVRNRCHSRCLRASASSDFRASRRNPMSRFVLLGQEFGPRPHGLRQPLHPRLPTSLPVHFAPRSA